MQLIAWGIFKCDFVKENNPQQFNRTKHQKLKTGSGLKIHFFEIFISTINKGDKNPKIFFASALQLFCVFIWKISSNDRMSLLTSLFKGEGATTRSHKVDLLEPRPSAIISLLILGPSRKHVAVRGGSPNSGSSLYVFLFSRPSHASPTGRRPLWLCL